MTWRLYFVFCLLPVSGYAYYDPLSPRTARVSYNGEESMLQVAIYIHVCLPVVLTLRLGPLLHVCNFTYAANLHASARPGAQCSRVARSSG